jgi:hypothetical protein
MFMGLVAAAIARKSPEFAGTTLGRRWIRSASAATAGAGA